MEPTQPLTPQPMPSPSSSRHSRVGGNLVLLIPLFSFILLLLISATAYLGYQNMQLQKEVSMMKQAPSPTPTPTGGATADPTADWETYTTADGLLSFKAPKNLEVTIEKNYISAISNTKELLSITYTTDGTKPNGYSGVSAGNIVDGGKTNFLGTSIQKTKLVFNGINTSNLFGGKLGETNAIIEIKNNKFIISESFSNNDKGEQALETTFDQILSTFQFIQPIKDITLQQFLKEQCKSGNPPYLDPQVFPFSVDSPIILSQQNGHSLYCVSTGISEITNASIDAHTTNESYNFNVYDSETKELGHGGAPLLGFWGREIYNQSDIKIGAFFNFPEGPATLGLLGVTIRGVREYRSLFSQPVSISMTMTAVKGDDPRLTKLLQPYAKDTGAGYQEITATTETYNGIISNFFDQLQPNTSEYQAVQNMIQALSAIHPNRSE